MKDRVVYACSTCGHQSVKWLGRCPECGEWNTFSEEVRTAAARKPAVRSVEARSIDEISVEDVPRTLTGIGEFDRVLGGGIVRGSLVLVAGEPGVGKSTLLLAAAGKLAGRSAKVLYISGEESLSQIKLRAQRLAVSGRGLSLAASTDVPALRGTLEDAGADLVIVDSIQTMYDPEIPTTAGSVAQVRENTRFFMEYAKRTGVPVFLVGHITKEGAIAGPKLLEHVVDTVLSFEGEPRANLRILRALKNRFGSTTEIGVFSMEQEGLAEVPDAGALFLEDFRRTLPGAAIFPSLEGSRTILLEIQSLVTPTYYGMPKRSVTGLDYNRASLTIAVLEKKLHFNFGTFDVYLNVGGGLRVDEPAADLATAVACVSSLKDIPPPERTVFFGEVALTGEIRPVSGTAARLKEAERLGFATAFLPASGNRDLPRTSLELVPVRWLKEAVDRALRF